MKNKMPTKKMEICSSCLSNKKLVKKAIMPKGCSYASTDGAKCHICGTITVVHSLEVTLCQE